MKLLSQILLAPFLLIVVALRIFDRVSGANRRPHVARGAGRLAALGDGLTVGALGAAVVSLTVILFSDALGVPTRALPLVTALPLLGGYFGAAVGFHQGGKDHDPAKRRADE
jgi:hypothetical protein